MFNALKIFGIFEQFEPMNFITNFGIVGAGMLGIFIVMGVIILSVLGLGGITAKKKGNSENE